MALNNKLAFAILIFTLLSVTGNLLVWFSTTEFGVLGRITQGGVNLCFDILPVLQPIGDLNSTTRFQYTKQLSVSDNSSAQVYYYADITPDWTSFSLNETSGSINVTILAGEEGNYTIYFWITHAVCGYEFNDSETINFTVFIFNFPPNWINFTRYFTIIEDGNLYLNLSEFVDDPNNDTLAFSHNSTPQIFASFNLTPEGVINFTVNDSDVGTHWVNITVTDTSNISNSSIFRFTVNNVNDAPLLDAIPDQEACEDTAFSYQANAIDQDLQIPNTPERLHYYDNTTLFVINEDTGEISFTPTNSSAGMHNIRVYVSDEEAADFKDFYLDIIEVNDAPVLQSIGAQTIYVNDSFNYTASASDEEDGNSPGTLRFNLTFLNGTQIFDINRTNGSITFTANDSMLGTYSIRVCVNDTSLETPHANASSTCGDGNSQSDCETFSLTIVSENRAPSITSYYPEENQTIQETESIIFNVTARDPDGTITTIYWYNNNVLVQTTNALNDTYTFTTDYSSAGVYNITVNVSDGLLSDSVTWNITVLDKTQPSVLPETIGVGGGAAGVGACKEIWSCTDWSICQNASTRQSEVILGEEYSETLITCSRSGIPPGKCGIQTRICSQVSLCRTSFKKPSGFQVCHYTLVPSCFDSIRNCHGPFALCEVLVDCGGPCNPCPTCSDGIQNQGEEWIDCGGPCPACPVEYPKPPKCGDKRCEISELLTCRTDCGLFQLTTLVLVFLLVALTIITRKEFIRKTVKKGEEELKKKRKYINNTLQLARRAIDDGDITLARHYYNITKRAYEALPVNEKKRVYGKIVKIFSDINKLKGK